jgi:periplasmic divalent cation tolerance protein
MDRAVMLYTTFPSVVEAEKAGKALVEDRLAACVNIVPGMISHYRWQGAIERGEEAVMLIKTRASLAEPVRAAVGRRTPTTRRPFSCCRSKAWTKPISPGSWPPPSPRTRLDRAHMNGRQRRCSPGFIYMNGERCGASHPVQRRTGIVASRSVMSRSNGSTGSPQANL